MQKNRACRPQDTLSHRWTLVCIKVLKLGGIMATDGKHDFTHFVVPEFHRTENLLVALAAGRSVVTPQWVRDSAAEGTWLNTRHHLIQVCIRVHVERGLHTNGLKGKKGLFALRRASNHALHRDMTIDGGAEAGA